MIAAWTNGYGAADLLELREVPEPALGADELRIEVEASPVTAGDIRLRTANFPGMSVFIGRAMFGIFGPRRKVQGSIFAGTVVEVGAEVTGFAVGDAVFGESLWGAWAQRLVVSASGAVAHRPDGVDAATAAAAPYGGGTALHFLKEAASVQPGERVLVIGAGGGVGRYAVQVAKVLGAHVTAVDRERKRDMLLGLGADVVRDRESWDFRTAGECFDVIFDIADVTSFSESRVALTETGRYLSLSLGLRVLFDMLRTRRGGGQRAIFSVAMASRESIEVLATWLAAGHLAPVVADCLPLEDIAQAHVLVEDRVVGLVLVSPSRESMARSREVA